MKDRCWVVKLWACLGVYMYFGLMCNVVFGLFGLRFFLYFFLFVMLLFFVLIVLFFIDGCYVVKVDLLCEWLLEVVFMCNCVKVEVYWLIVLL